MESTSRYFRLSQYTSLERFRDYFHRQQSRLYYQEEYWGRDKYNILCNYQPTPESLKDQLVCIIQRNLIRTRHKLSF